MIDAGLELEEDRLEAANRLKSSDPDQWSKGDIDFLEGTPKKDQSGLVDKLHFGSDYAYPRCRCPPAAAAKRRGHQSLSRHRWVKHQLKVDGEVVKEISKYRLLPTCDGVRIIFIRPAKAKLVEFELDPELGTADTASLRAAAGTYSIGIKRPTESPPSLKPLKLGSLVLNDSVDLRFDGSSGWEKTQR